MIQTFALYERNHKLSLCICAHVYITHWLMWQQLANILSKSHLAFSTENSSLHTHLRLQFMHFCSHCLWCQVTPQTPPPMSAQVGHDHLDMPSVQHHDHTAIVGQIMAQWTKTQRTGQSLTLSTTLWSTLSFVSSSLTISSWPKPQANRKQSLPAWRKADRPKLCAESHAIHKQVQDEIWQTDWIQHLQKHQWKWYFHVMASHVEHRGNLCCTRQWVRARASSALK